MRFLRAIFVFLAALLILFEEWLWAPLQRFMQAFGQRPLIRRLAQGIQQLPPYGAVTIFLLPGMVLLPFKLGGLWLLSQGHPLLGVSIFLLAKIVGTALVAWLFGLTKTTLLQIGWFRRGYGQVVHIRDLAHHWIHQQALYHAIKASLNWVKTRLRPCITQAWAHLKDRYFS